MLKGFYMTTLTTEELVKKAYHAGVVRWDVAKELVELIVQTEREACAQMAWDYGWKRVDSDDAQGAAVEITDLIRSRGTTE
jgi:hypothetical protein